MTKPGEANEATGQTGLHRFLDWIKVDKEVQTCDGCRLLRL